MSNLIYLAPVLGIVALLFAFVLAGKVNAMDEGTDRMKEIAGSIAEGARAFLFAEYKILVIFAVASASISKISVKKLYKVVCFCITSFATCSPSSVRESMSYFE